MLGGIYTSEDCPVCGTRMVDNGKDAVCCPNPKHSRKCRSVTMFVKFGDVFKRFSDYARAFQFLHGLRFKKGEGTYDERDYKRDNPLGFVNQAERYLEVKRQTVKPGSFTHIKREMNKAAAYFGQRNVKEIGYAELEDYLLSQTGISSKTRHNIKTILHTFFVWLTKRREIKKDQIPDFPELPFELGFRKTVAKDTQDAILEEVKRLSEKNPRIYIGVKWLCTYVSIRPSELRFIKEKDVDLEQGFVVIRKHKTIQTKSMKVVPLLEEDIELLRNLPRGFPEMYLFRRDSGGGGRHAGSPFGKHLLYDFWKLACGELGISGVDLYGGTRHSSMQHLRKHFSKEDVKELSLHSTNAALDRYLEVDFEVLREGYSVARSERTSSAPILHLPKRR